MDWTFPTPLCLFVRVTIRREKYSEFKDLARQVAFAYQQHPSRMAWAAYATVAGPSLNVCILIPLGTLGDLDTMVSLERVMDDVYGRDGAVTLREFQNCVLDMSSSVLDRIETGFSAETHDEPAQYLYHVVLNVSPSGSAKFLQGMRRVAAIVPASPFALYGTFAGTTRVHGFAMGDTIAGLEVVGNLQSRVVSGYGQPEGAQIWADIHDTLVDTETSILRHIGHQTQ